MAASQTRTRQYHATHFTESAGAILFRAGEQEVCLVYYTEKNEWLLAKGRRNVGESRLAAALRKVREETGFHCEALKLDMTTRAPPAVEVMPYYADEPRVHRDISEPFMLTFREINDVGRLKLIWWYLANTIDHPSGEVESTTPEATFASRFFSFADAPEKLTYQADRDVLQSAVDLFIQ